MSRREFITRFGVVTATNLWPLAARAQQPERMRRIGVLLPGTSDDAEYQARQAGFLQALARDRKWHKPDHQRCPQFGRYRGASTSVVALKSEVAIEGDLIRLR